MTADEISQLMHETSGQISLALLRAIDFELIRAIEIIEGRVPSDSEAAKFGARVIAHDGHSCWTWRGQLILELIPPTFGQPILNYRLQRFIADE